MRLPQPTPSLIARHMRAYDASPNGGVPDAAVRAVFSAFPANTDPGHVLAKVAVLNSLYSTNIFAVRDVALSIVNARIDPLLKLGSRDVHEALATQMVGGRLRNVFSFATKYAHWHRPDVYPIYDSFVRQQLLAYRRQDQFAEFEERELRTGRFMDLFAQFRSYYGLQACSLRDIDKWLWRQGRGKGPLDAT